MAVPSSALARVLAVAGLVLLVLSLVAALTGSGVSTITEADAAAAGCPMRSGTAWPLWHRVLFFFSSFSSHACLSLALALLRHEVSVLLWLAPAGIALRTAFALGGARPPARSRLRAAVALVLVLPALAALLTWS